MTNRSRSRRDAGGSPGARHTGRRNPAPDTKTAHADAAGDDRDTPLIQGKPAASVSAFLAAGRAGTRSERSAAGPEPEHSLPRPSGTEATEPIDGRSPRGAGPGPTGTADTTGAGLADPARPDADSVGDRSSKHTTIARAWRALRAQGAEPVTPVTKTDAPVQPSATRQPDTAGPDPGHTAITTPGPEDPTTASASARGARPEVLHLGAMLLERSLVTRDQLQEAMERQKRTRRRLGRVLVEMGFATQEAVLDALSAQLGVPSTRVNSYTVNPDAVQSLSEKVARKHMAFPLLKVGSTLVVAIASPKDLHALDDLRFAAGCNIQMMVALETEIQSAIDKYYGNTFGATEAEDVGTVVIDIPGPQLDLHDEVAERSAVSLVDRIIARAATDRASDIHLEPAKNSLRVRFRIDGTFHDVAQLLLAMAPAVLARVKVLSAMDITEHRLPQDGRFSATVGGRGLDVRTSTYPTIWGEKAVLRLLDRTSLQLSLNGLMPNPAREAFRDLINRPEGILLVTGPTGSGKTSTLYASLAEIAEKGKNIITIEDPVEYWLPGVNQGQTNHKSGFTFARGLRAILRQDPDVIMVGEIRDAETLETAIEAALTGHLVLSTLHTNNAVATVTRLLEMGLEPYLLASAIAGILAQRLVRKICERCKEPIAAPSTLQHLFHGEVPTEIYRGMGCDDCRGTGFLGRQGIFELLTLTDELRTLMHDRASELELTEAAKRGGMTTLRDACMASVADGTTTLEEVIRVTMAGREDEADEAEIVPPVLIPQPRPAE